MSVDLCAELLSRTLYYRRFFPYYTGAILAGIDENGWYFENLTTRKCYNVRIHTVNSKRSGFAKTEISHAHLVVFILIPSNTRFYVRYFIIQAFPTQLNSSFEYVTLINVRNIASLLRFFVGLCTILWFISYRLKGFNCSVKL